MVNIQGMYIALFGRPADPAGLAHFEAAAEACGDVSWISGLVQSSEFGMRVQGRSIEAAIETIYQNLFDRDPDADGLAYYAEGLNSGHFTTASLVAAIVGNAVVSDLATLNAKVDAAELFTLQLDTTLEILAYVGPQAAEIGRTFIDGVTAAAPATENDVDNVILMLTRSGGQFEAGEVRDQPILTTTTLAPIEENGSRVITQADLLAGGADPQGLSLMAFDLQLIGNGTLISNGDGSWTFTAAPGDESDVTLTYSVTNSWSLPVATKALLDITPSDLPPPPSPAYWNHHRIETAPAYASESYGDDSVSIVGSYHFF